MSKDRAAPRLRKRKSGRAASRQATPPELLARGSLSPTTQAANTLASFNCEFGDLPIDALADALEEECKAANRGDLSGAEATLASQARTLDAIFHALARRAQRAGYLNQFESTMRLALKAQSQCRSTLEAIAVIKNPPPVAFVRQANIASGPQQVNNGAAAGPARAGVLENRPNEVLEDKRGERLELGTASAASGADPRLETVGVLNRPEDSRG